MVNFVIIHGRLTKDPELRKTQSGVSVCSFTVAVDRSYTKPGEDKVTDFFDVSCWRGLADLVSKHFTKGKEILVTGSMQARKWQDKEGNNRVSWELQAENIDFCGSKGGGAAPMSTGFSAPPAPDFAQMAEDDDGELPF